MTSEEVRDLATRIADVLFTPGGRGGEKATHLKLYRNDLYLCGWAEGPATGAIEGVVEDWLLRRNGRRGG